MKGNHWMIAVPVAAAVWIHTASTRAEQSECRRVSRANVVSCALAVSLSAEAELHGVEAARGREEAARPLLPSNPVLSGRIARRNASAVGSDTNWSVTASQQFDLSGSRGARRRAAAFDRTAQQNVLSFTRRDAAAQALRAYFDALAGREELLLVRRLEESFQRVADASKAAAERGLAAGVDADVAEATLISIVSRRADAERRAKHASAALASLLGLEPTIALDLSGDLEPLRVADVRASRAAPDLPQVRALEAQARAERARADVYRRARIPTPTLSVFVERDGFAENVLGAGLAIPVPLPHPLGRTYSGEIQEAEALAASASTNARKLRREVRLGLATALAEYETSQTALGLYTPERTSRAEQALHSMAAELAAGRLAIRDAIVAQTTLVELLVSALRVRQRLCVASVDLAVAAGVPLERGAP